MKTPQPKKIEHLVQHHGDTIVDPYFWMRNIEEDKDVKAHLDTENAFTEEALAGLKDFREQLYQELKSRHLETYTTSKYPYGEFLYYSRYEKGKEYAIHCRQADANAPEEIILDENILAEGQEYFELGAFSLSHDHNLLAYSYDNNGSERFTVEIKNLKTGENLPDKVTETSYGVEWYKGDKAFTFVRLDENLRPYQVRVHTLGKEESRLLHEDTSGEYFLHSNSDLAGDYIYVGAYGSADNTVYYTPIDDSEAELTLVQEKIQDKEYFVDQKDGFFYIRVSDTNSNFRIVKTPTGNPSQDNWIEVIAPSDKRSIVSHSCFEKFNVYCFREEGLKYFEVHLNDGTIKKVPFPAKAYQVGESQNYNYDTDNFRYNYSALNQPPTVYDYNTKTEESTTGGYLEMANAHPTGRRPPAIGWRLQSP